MSILRYNLMMIRKMYRLINWLSIDVTLGAMACAVFFLQLLGVPISWVPIFLLGLSVWVIYTADHLIDAQHIGQVRTLRHRFHRRHYMWLLIALFGAISLIGILAFFVRVDILGWGVFMMMLVVTYLILRSYYGFIKEIGTALLFCAGVLLPGLAEVASFGKLFAHWEVFSFMDNVLINVLVFSWYEYKDDAREGFHSFAVHFGKSATRLVIYILLLLQVCIFLWGLYSHWQLGPVLILFSMTLVLLTVFYFPKYFKHNERFRLLGDSVFLFPVFMWLAKYL